MDAQKRKRLVEQAKDAGCTLEGSPTIIAGYAYPHATLAPGFGGFWQTSWETVERVLAAEERDFKACDVLCRGWAWLGDGSEIPEALRGKVI